MEHVPCGEDGVPGRPVVVGTAAVVEGLVGDPESRVHRRFPTGTEAEDESPFGLRLYGQRRAGEDERMACAEDDRGRQSGGGRHPT